MWTRSAFYEKEAEIFVQSETFAIDLIEKFEEERDAYSFRVASPSDCEKLLPTGCFLCKGFGPFYDRCVTSLWPRRSRRRLTLLTD